MTKKNLIIAGLAAIVLFYLPVLFLDQNRLLFFVQEDGFYESIGALLFFFASFGFLVLFLRDKKRSLFFLLFAAAFFFAGGEEISWGQRIFHFATPASIEAVNAQKEFSLHNLNIFQHGNDEGGYQLSIKELMNFNHLFVIFWFSYCVLLPLANRYLLTIRNLCARIRLPIPSLWIGALFLINEVGCKVLEYYGTAVFHYTQDPKISEIKEALWALFLFIMALYFIYAAQRQTESGSRRDVVLGGFPVK